MEFLIALHEYPALLWTFAAVIGLLFGSFLNVVIHRLPLMLERRWRAECEELINDTPISAGETFNLLVPRSRCPHCAAQLSALQNIPLISWLLLRGRCHTCSGSISVQYPAVELLSGILCAIVAMHFGVSPQTLAAIVLSWALIALSGIDLKTTLLPDDITLPLLWLGLICNLFGLFTDIYSAVIGAACGYLILWSVYHLFRLITGKEGMGYGDFKLLAALGAWLGWQHLPMIILLSSLLGAIVGITLITVLGRNRNIPIPFGPYLAGAGWISLLWGEQLAALYQRVALG